ncbi:MAG: tetratricopeptide repeat protein [Sandaracinaceae bacterium]|nr:tetratricopeptide repeat protein [Sandaracinaceae bacterium]
MASIAKAQKKRASVCLMLAALGPIATLKAAAQAPWRTRHAQELVILGERFAKAGDRLSARACFREAIESDPNLAEAYVALGELELERQALADALHVFRLGVARATPDLRLWLGLAKAFEASGRSEEAQRVLQEAERRFVAHREEILRSRLEQAERAFRWSEAISIVRRLLLEAERRNLQEEVKELELRLHALKMLVNGLDPLSRLGNQPSLVRRALVELRR